MILFFAFLVVIASAFINGFFYFEAYNSGIAPFINSFSVAPAIPYILFVGLSLAASVISKNRVDKKYKLDEKEFWVDYVTLIVSKFLALCLLWIFNWIFL